MAKTNEIEIIADANGGFKAKYYIGGHMLLTKRFGDAGNAATTAANNILIDSPGAVCKVKDNEIWQINLKGV